VLDDAAIERFARQIVVPGVGAEGQERICSTRIVVIGEPAGVALARTYACAAGFCVEARTNRPIGCVLVAGTRSLDAQSLADLAVFAAPILWYRLDDAGIIAGIAAAGAPIEGLVASAAGSADDDIRHALAAADLVASAIAIALGWPDLEPQYRLDLR